MESGWPAIPFLVVVFFFFSSSFSLVSKSSVIRKGSFGASFSNFTLRLGLIRANETHLVMYIKNISLLFSTPRNNIHNSASSCCFHQAAVESWTYEWLHKWLSGVIIPVVMRSDLGKNKRTYLYSTLFSQPQKIIFSFVFTLLLTPIAIV